MSAPGFPLHAEARNTAKRIHLVLPGHGADALVLCTGTYHISTGHRVSCGCADGKRAPCGCGEGARAEEPR
eukprot:1924214-Rhodomonas_salina.1